MISRSGFEGYSTRDLAGLLRVSRERIYRWVKLGGLEPKLDSRRRLRFGFQDLVLLRSVQALAEARLPAMRIRRALGRLREDLPRGRPLSSVAISVEDGKVVVREGGAKWDAASGQQRFDFEVAALAEQVAPLARRAAVAAREREAELDAEAWYELAYELEAAEPREAIDAYERALRLDPDHADSHLNLGRLRHEAGDLESAVEHYRRSGELLPGSATAQFNLGVARQDCGQLKGAAEAYERALEIDPALADAHFNLAAVAEAREDPATAIRHLKAYKQLTR